MIGPPNHPEHLLSEHKTEQTSGNRGRQEEFLEDLEPVTQHIADNQQN